MNPERDDADLGRDVHDLPSDGECVGHAHVQENHVRLQDRRAHGKAPSSGAKVPTTRILLSNLQRFLDSTVRMNRAGLVEAPFREEMELWRDPAAL